MYGYVYIVRNIKNGKKYIGKHKSETFDFSYYGSGKIISQAIKKDGKENFKVEMVESFNTLSELNDGEKYYIKLYDAQNNPDFYNISEGGDGGRGMLGKHHSEETKRKISESEKGKKYNPSSIEKFKKTMSGKSEDELKLISHHKSMSHKGKKKSSDVNKKISNTLREGYATGKYKSQKGKDAWNKGVAQTAEQKKKISEKMSGRKHITNGVSNKMITEDKLCEYLNSGWRLGRTIKKSKIVDKIE